MQASAHEQRNVAGWGVVRPSRPARATGLSMAGFRGGDAGPVDVRVIPHPAVTLVLEFGNGPLVVDDADGRQQRGDLVAGFLHDGVRVRGENIECLQVRLSPVTARAVLGVPPSELDGTVVALDELWGPDAAQLRQRLRDTTTWQDRFTSAETFLAHRAETGPPVDPEVKRAWNRIVVSHGRARVEELAAEVGWSRRRLWSRFHSQIGLPPKRAAMLVRFDRAVHRLASGEAAARVAAERGYADQPHLHRDVKAFTAMTPATVIRQPWLAVDEIAWDGHATRENH